MNSVANTDAIGFFHKKSGVVCEIHFYSLTTLKTHQLSEIVHKHSFSAHFHLVMEYDRKLLQSTSLPIPSEASPRTDET